APFDVPQHHRRARDETAHEAATGLVVPGEQQEHREQQRGVEDGARAGGEDERPLSSHGSPASVESPPASARPARTRPAMPSPATASTLISPRVSRPRKSTRMTLTMLRPPASGSARSTYSPDTGVLRRDASAMRAKHVTNTPTASAIARRSVACSRQRTT